MTCLLLAAFPPELSGLDVAPPEGWRVACTGVGAISSAVTTARLLEQERPSRVLFIATCGALDEGIAIGDLISVSEVIATSLEELEGRAFRPSNECTRWKSGWPLPFPAHLAAVPPAITRTEEGARLLAKIAAVEHLELSGVFAACADAGVPVAAALAVANRVGPNAHAEWTANHAAVSARLVAALKTSGVFPD